MKIIIKNHSRYTFDSVTSLVKSGVRASYMRFADDITVYVNDARGKNSRIVIAGRRAMRLYLPKPKFDAGGGFFAYLEQVDNVAAVRLVRWATLILAGRSRADLNDDQCSTTGPTPWDGLRAQPRVRFTNQAPNKEAGAEKLHATKIKKAQAKVDYYDARASKALTFRSKWERKLRALKASSHLVGKPRGYKPKPLTIDKLAELDAAIHSEDP